MTTSTATSAHLIQPYLFFDGRCEEAVELYRTALGAEVLMLMRVKDSPEPHQLGTRPPGSEDKILHTSFRIGETIIMASDGFCQGKAEFDGFRLSLTLPEEAEARRVFAALSEAGTVQMPLEKTAWTPLFGMLTDRFGVGWMITLPV